MNLWRKISYWDKKIDQTPKNKIINLLIILFSISFVCGSLLSVVIRSFQIRTIKQIEKDIRRIESESMNKLLEKTVASKYK